MPPKRTPKIDENSLPRINDSLSQNALRVECKARGHRSNVTKEEALRTLVLGSVHLSATKEYKCLEAIKKLMNEELAALHASQALKLEEERKRRLEEERHRQETAQAEKRRRLEMLREAEKEKQKAFHTLTRPEVHNCPLASTSDLSMNGLPRLGRCYCSNRLADKKPSPQCAGKIVFSCEACGFDICEGCFDFKTLSTEERLAKAAAAQKIREERELQEQLLEQKRLADQKKREEQRKAEERNRQERRRREEEENRKREMGEKQKKYNVAFTHSSKRPSPTEQNLRQLEAFVVWSSAGYPPDGFHSYSGPPSKEFDSSFKTLQEANARAVYLFYFGNTWGVDGEESFDSEVTAKRINGALKLKVCPPDSEEWTVGVVCKEAFAHL